METYTTQRAKDALRDPLSQKLERTIVSTGTGCATLWNEETREAYTRVH